MPYCPECGVTTAPDDSFCSECGASLSNATSATTAESANEWDDPAGVSAGRPSGSSRDTNFYIGAVLAVVGVVFLPFVFVFVALPESIAAMLGKSLQHSLPRDARDNPFVSGSFLIFRWFGNFIVLLIVVGVLGLLLLVAL